MSDNTRKFSTPSQYTLPARLVKDPEIKVLEANGDKPAKHLLKITQVDGASSDYYQDVFMESTFDVTNKPTHPLLRVRKGDFVVVYGKPEYRGYAAKDGTIKVAGEIRYPRDFAIGVPEFGDREAMPLAATEKAEKATKLPW